MTSKCSKGNTNSNGNNKTYFYKANNVNRNNCANNYNTRHQRIVAMIVLNSDLFQKAKSNGNGESSKQPIDLNAVSKLFGWEASRNHLFFVSGTQKQIVRDDTS